MSQANIELKSRINLREGILSRAKAEYAEQLELQVTRAADAALRLSQMEGRIELLKSTHGAHISGIRTSSEQSREKIIEERGQLNNGTQVTLTKIDERLKTELAQIETDKAIRLRKAGIDNQENRRLELEINELNEQIKAVNDKRSEIDSYRRWRTETLPDLPRRIGVMQSLQGKKEQLDRAYKTFEDELNLARQKITDRRKALRVAGQQDADQQRILRNTIESIDRISLIDETEEVAWIPNLTVADIDDEVSKLMRQRTDLQRRGKAEYGTIYSRFREESLLHTPQGAAIEQIASLAHNTAVEINMVWIEATPGLLEYIEVSHPDQKTKLIVQTKNLSDELCDRRGKLETLHKSIQKLGRDATAKAREVLGAFAQIRQFEFRVASRIHSLTFWEDLSNYEQQYRRWQMMSEEYLPTDSFIEALCRVERQIAEGGFTSKFSDCFDVSVSCNDQGRTKVATNNAELIGISSTGVTKIIVAMIYVSLFELLRQDADFKMSVPIDEALELSPENYVALVDYFNSRGISILAGFPGGAPELLRQFPNRYTLERRHDSDAIIVKEYGTDVDDELDDLNAALSSEEAEFVL